MEENLEQIVESELSRKITTQEWVTEILRKAIINGVFKDGEPIPTAELSNKLGVSRMPIRIALLQLENEGLVSLRPHKQAVAIQLSPDEIMKVYEIRFELEALAVRLAIERISDSQLKELIDTHKEMEQTTEPTKYMELNDIFHNKIYESSQNEILINMISQLRNKIQKYLKVFLKQNENIDAANKDHKDILDAIINKDTELAELLICKHLKSTSVTVSDYLRKTLAKEQEL